MKALTLTQPWASLVAIGAKTIETRSWRTSYTGPIAIHAGAGLGPAGGFKGLYKLYYSEPFYSEFFPRYGALSEWAMPLGAIVATAYLVACGPTEDIAESKQLFYPHANGHPQFWELDSNQRAFGDYSPGRYAWLLCDIVEIREPIPARGALGLWDWKGGPG